MNKEKLIQFTQNILPISPDKAKFVVEKFQAKAVSKNDFILKEGEVCNEVHFLEEGLIRAYTYDLDGNDITTAFYSENILVNDFLSFFKRIPSKENIQAVTDCKTWYMRYEDVQVNFHSIPEFREFGRLNLINSYATLKQRMLSTLHETAEQRYANLINSNPEIFKYTTLKNVASYLGVTDTSLSRIRKEFVKR